MSLTPAGEPVWLRRNTPDTYGGHANKKNIGGISAVNGQTDIDVTEYVAMARDVAAISRVVDFAWMRLQLNDTTTSDPTLLEYQDLAGDSAPLSITRNADNDFTITYDATVADTFGVTGVINLIGGHASAQGTTGSAFVWETLDPDANGNNEAIRFRGFSGGGLTDPIVDVAICTGQAV